MHTTPRRFKLFVTPGTLRWNRWAGQLIPAIDAYGAGGVPGLPALAWTENWAYADGTMAVVAAANWSGFSHTFGGVNANFTIASGNMLTAGTANSLSSVDQTALAGGALKPINAGQPWAFSVLIVSLLSGHVVSNGQTCGLLLQFIDAGGNAFNLTVSYDPGVGVVVAVDRNGVTAGTSNRGFPAAYAKRLTMKWAAGRIQVYEGNAKIIDAAGASLTAGLRPLQIQTTGVNHAGGTCVQLGAIKGYGAIV